MANKPLVNAYITGRKDGNDAPYVFKTVNIVWGTDIASQMAEENCKYVIKWIFDLKGSTLTIPKNCILEFDGGRFKNGSVVWDNTKVLNLYGCDILQNIQESGTRYTLGGND